MVHCNTSCKTPELSTNYVSQNHNRQRETEGVEDLFIMEIHRKSELKRENLILKDKL